MSQITSNEIDSLIDKLRILQTKIKYSANNSCESSKVNPNIQNTQNQLNKDTIAINGQKITLENILNVLDDQLTKKIDSDNNSLIKEKSNESIKKEKISLFDISSYKHSNMKCLDTEISEIKPTEQSAFFESKTEGREISCWFEEIFKNFAEKDNKIFKMKELKEKGKNFDFDEKYNTNNNFNNSRTSSFMMDMI